MKQIKIVTFAALLLSIGVVLPGCKKFLTQDPISTVSPNRFWQDQNDANTWMAGIYNQMQSTLSSAFFSIGAKCVQIMFALEEQVMRNKQ
ncbi:hypothetical protein LWM68_27920 [Niabella sp. W65]|nr:hypothetical protein [Niabella sp. W65]MCH7366261.1 hypothetical protein [Niabella sp. W65]ULT41985.1 hypothetical protein KRR40_46865 [Niabella sp. I65]